MVVLAPADTLAGMSAGNAMSQASTGHALLHVVDNTQLAYILANEPATAEPVLPVDFLVKYVACTANAQESAAIHVLPAPRLVDGVVSIASTSATCLVQFPARLSRAISAVKRF